LDLRRLLALSEISEDDVNQQHSARASALVRTGNCAMDSKIPGQILLHHHDLNALILLKSVTPIAFAAVAAPTGKTR